LGVWAAGASVRELGVARDIYLHTAAVIEDAEDLGGYRPVSPEDCFDTEYWELEQAKLALEGRPKSHAGEVALVTGAASGIGLAVVRALLGEGAAVVGVDLSPVGGRCAGDPGFVAVVGDICDPLVVARALEEAVSCFGGIDILVTAAGIFGAVEPVTEISPASWRKTVEVNFGGTLSVLKEAHPFLKCSPKGGRVVVVGSKNVWAPGRGAGVYSASKAAVNQLARVAALEWAADGVRVNIVHPDGVFDTGLWTDELLAERASSYEMTVEEYKRRNLLGQSITSADVASVVLALCGSSFAKVTGAQLPIDGGNERVI
ncbi:MAG: SDR family oxidoreductase, partial [Acidimicrobiales bacterium]